MTTLDTICGGLEDALATIPGLAVFDAPEGASPPWAMVLPPDVDFQQTFGSTGVHRATVNVYVLVAAAGGFSGNAARLLRRYMDASGSESVRAALLADPTLGGEVEGLSVPSARVTGDEEVAGIGFMGAVFAVQLHWRTA